MPEAVQDAPGLRHQHLIHLHLPGAVPEAVPHAAFHQQTDPCLVRRRESRLGRTIGVEADAVQSPGLDCPHELSPPGHVRLGIACQRIISTEVGGAEIERSAVYQNLVSGCLHGSGMGGRIGALRRLPLPVRSFRHQGYLAHHAVPCPSQGIRHPMGVRAVRVNHGIVHGHPYGMPAGRQHTQPDMMGAAERTVLPAEGSVYPYPAAPSCHLYVEMPLLAVSGNLEIPLIDSLPQKVPGRLGQEGHVHALLLGIAVFLLLVPERIMEVADPGRLPGDGVSVSGCLQDARQLNLPCLCAVLRLQGDIPFSR